MPTYLGDQDPVAGSDAHGHALAVAVNGAGADGQDLGLVELLDARLGQEDARGRLGLGLDALDQDPVEQRDERLDGADRGGLFIPRQQQNSVSQSCHCHDVSLIQWVRVVASAAAAGGSLGYGELAGAGPGLPAKAPRATTGG